MSNRVEYPMCEILIEGKAKARDSGKSFFSYDIVYPLLNTGKPGVYEGDTFMCTDNPILLKNTTNARTVMCVQRKAEKKIVTEEDIIKANKLAFNDDIGRVTNNATAMFEVQARFAPDSEEYKTLEYRILCAQLYQQNTID